MEKWMQESLIVALATAAGAAVLYAALMIGLKRLIPAGLMSQNLARSIFKAVRVPLATLVALIWLKSILPAVQLPGNLSELLAHVLNVLQISVFAWVAVRIAGVGREMIVNAFDAEVSDNLKARKIHTQIRVAEQILTAVIIIIAVACVLMTFDKVRQLGVSLLASAGVIGIIMGFAAQKTIATLFAGIQIAITQPIRVDDVVIVEGEWGRIEEITLTYVVVKIWDLRRLVIPITWFLEKPFQNWTRVSADILGSVFIYADYTVPFEALRAELRRVCESSGLWDGKVCGLQVTDTTVSTVQMRALISAKDSSSAWDLRCLVRERLIGFMQDKYPECLPRTRVSVEPLTDKQTGIR